MNIDKWLSFEDTNKGMEVIKQKDLDYYTDVFSPWQTKQKLKLWREVEWSAWWGWNYYMAYGTQSTTPSITTFVVGFEPKIIKITASLNSASWNWTISIWTATSLANQAYTHSYMNPDYVTNSSNSRILYLRDNTWNRVYAEISEINTTGFKIDFNRTDFACSYVIECYG